MKNPLTSVKKLFLKKPTTGVTVTVSTYNDESINGLVLLDFKNSKTGKSLFSYAVPKEQAHTLSTLIKKASKIS